MTWLSLCNCFALFFFFFFQAEDGIRDLTVTGVQTCALPISLRLRQIARYLHARWGVAGAIPPEALIPPGFFKAQGNVANWLKNANAAGVKVSRTLAILQRPEEREAIAGVSGLPRRTVSKILRALKEEELVTENR